MRYWILLILYLVLVLLYAWKSPTPIIPVWPTLTKESAIALVEKCQTTSDCSAHHICLNGTCTPQLLRGDECYPDTGKWTLVKHEGNWFAACICTDPTIVTQRHFGGNCVVEMACKPYGTFNMQKQECDCIPGYVAQGHTCRKMLAIQRLPYESCDPDEVRFQDIDFDRDGFSRSYIHQHKNKQCFKRPCTFDAITGRPLKKARYEKGIGCLCDPRLGQFGVNIESLNEYVMGPGYNACVSLFEEPIEHPIPFQVVAYFFLMHDPPVVYLQYQNINPKDVIQPLRSTVKNGSLQIGQEFPYDYMQMHFRQGLPFTARIRSQRFHGYGNFEPYQYKNVSQPMTVCRSIIKQLRPLKADTYQQAFRLLYNYPVCFIESDDTTAPAMYRGHFVSNPYHLTYLHKTDQPRSNGLVLSFANEEWSLDLAPSYDIDRYQYSSNKDIVPILEEV